MISLKEALIRKNRTVDVDAIRKQEIVNFLKENYLFFELGGTNNEQISYIHDIERYIEIDKNKVNVNCNIFLKNKLDNVTNNLFQFGKIKGHFMCSYCNLKTFQNCPEYVEGNFVGRGNAITSLTGSPKIVENVFDCSYSNSLRSLEGSPDKVNCYMCYCCNKLKTLQGITQNISQCINCDACLLLTDLEGISDKFDGFIACGFIFSLKGCPKNASIYINIVSIHKPLIKGIDEIDPKKIKKRVPIKYQKIFNSVDLSI